MVFQKHDALYLAASLVADSVSRHYDSPQATQEANEVRSAAAAAALKSKRSRTTLRYKHTTLWLCRLRFPTTLLLQYRLPLRTTEHCDLSIFCLESQNVTQHDRSLDDEGPRLQTPWRGMGCLKKDPTLVQATTHGCCGVR